MVAQDKKKNWKRFDLALTAESEARDFAACVHMWHVYVARFYEMAQPIHALTKMQAVFRWTDIQDQSFETLKAALVDAPLLSSPLDDGRYSY